MKFSEKILKQEMAKGKAVSFDVFDTALQRKLSTPRHIFQVMEPQLAGLLQTKIASFAQSRMEAESEAWMRARHGNSKAQITLLEIYQALAKRHGLSTPEIDRLRDLEIETEKQFTYGHPLFLRLYRLAHEMGLKVFFLSDMYLPSSALQEILEHYGYEQAQVFVSAEQGGNKASGRLYRIVQEKLGLAAPDFLHLGDNFYADFLRARLNGWRAIHSAAWNCVDLNWALPPRETLSVSSSLCLELDRKKTLADLADDSGRAPDFWDDFGYRIAGPLYFGFLHWLSLQAERDGVRRLLLCARDGFPLLRGFELLREKWDLPLETSYFYASRRLFNLARIRELDRTNLDFLFMPNPGLKVRDFVSRLGFTPEAHEAALLSLGFTSLDQQVVHSDFGRFIDPASRKRLEQWLNANQTELLDRVQDERRLIHDYFDQTQLADPHTAVVDLGWKATVCDSLFAILEETNPNAKGTAYFLGTYAQAQSFLDAGRHLQSFFFHLGKPVRRKNLVAACEGLVELIFCAPHGSVVGLEHGPSGIEPVYGRCECNEQQLASLETMREGAYRFIAETAPLLSSYRSFEPPAEYIEAILTQLVKKPTLAQAQHLGQMPYRVSYGDQDHPRPLAAPAAVGEDWSSNLAAYGQAPWKQGFLAQQTFINRPMLKLAHFARSVYVALTSKTLLASVRWLVFKH